MYDVNLYPPIFSQSYMPAFVYSTKCKVYFQISSLNTVEDLYHITAGNYGGIQVTVRKQYNNDNALKETYTSDIMLADLQKDEDNRYFIEINNSDIQGGFVLNEYYKVQIRFTGAEVTGTLPSATSENFKNWLNNNREHFSEWSSVVLIRGISAPSLNLTVNNKTSSNIQISTDYVEIKGSVSFNNKDTEKLQKYRILLYDNYGLFENNLDFIKEDSGDIYTTDNSIQYNISTALLENTSYTLEIILTTNNLYTWSPENKTITIGGITPMPADISLEEQVNNSTGCIKLILKRNLEYIQNNLDKINEYYTFVLEQDGAFSLASDNSISEQTTFDQTTFGQIVSEQENIDYDSMGYDGETVHFDPYWQRMLYYDEFNQEFLSQGDRIIIRRSSSIDDFGTWKNLADFELTQLDISELYWYDYTAEPGIWYRYQIIRYDNENKKTAELVTDIDHPVMLDTEDIFLNANGEQLILRFDPVINNFSNKIAESITDTIGSKYPFIRRNGNVNYRTFSLSGTITCFMDIEHNVFNGSPKDLYGASKKFYKQYNEEKNINAYNDFIYQKHFRQKVMRFLQSTNIKLLRSITEGNILVQLSGISFTPNQTLGRKIYSFNCTANEVAQCNEDNYIKYNIIKDNLKIFTKENQQEDNDL